MTLDTKGLYISGDWIDGQGHDLASRNPSNQETIWNGQEASTQQVEEALQSAQKAFQIWKSFSFEDRADIVEEFSEILNRRKDELAKAISEENGKPLWEALQEVSAASGKVAASRQAYLERCNDRHFEVGEAYSNTTFFPHGVLAVLGPFNFPLHLPGSHIVPAIMAGNTVVFKASEFTPHVGELLCECWSETGLPDGVFNLVQGGKDVGQSLVTSDHIQGVLFTGSRGAGVAIHKALAGRPEIMLSLELGGNNALVVEDIQNIDAAVETIILSSFITSGQRCVCARRLILPKGQLGDDCLQKLIEKVKCIQIGYPHQTPEPFMGPLIHEKAADLVMSSFQEWIQQGGKPLIEPIRKGPCLVSPGIIEMSQCRKVLDEEVFGPLLQIYRSEDFEDAIQLANQTQYGLSAGLICDDPEKWETFNQRVHAGIVNWNRQITGASGKAPFGGVGWSGNHRPSAWLAADYCSWPKANLCIEELQSVQLPPGL